MLLMESRIKAGFSIVCEVAPDTDFQMVMIKHCEVSICGFHNVVKRIIEP